MRVRLYGRLGEALGRETELAVAAPCTVREVRAALVARGVDCTGVRACVEDRMVGENEVMVVDTVVEFFPPLSGG